VRFLVEHISKYLTKARNFFHLFESHCAKFETNYIKKYNFVSIIASAIEINIVLEAMSSKSTVAYASSEFFQTKEEALR
jgi:hypothetical protein